MPCVMRHNDPTKEYRENSTEREKLQDNRAKNCGETAFSIIQRKKLTEKVPYK